MSYLYPPGPWCTRQTMTTRKALEEHIHRLLDEHVATHLATNYTDYTQLQVYQVGLATMRTKKG